MIENSSKGDNYKLFKHDLKFDDNDEIFDWFPKMSFEQYEIIRTLMSMSKCQYQKPS
jgi:hypothetical protein